MKYIILLLLVTACSSNKITEIKTEKKEKIHFKSPLLKYIHKKNVSQRTQIAYI